MPNLPYTCWEGTDIECRSHRYQYIDFMRYFGDRFGILAAISIPASFITLQYRDSLPWGGMGPRAVSLDQLLPRRFAHASAIWLLHEFPMHIMAYGVFPPGFIKTSVRLHIFLFVCRICKPGIVRVYANLF